MATSSRNLVLAGLVIVIAVAIVYMIDPTFGGIIHKRSAYEGFETNGEQVVPADGAAASSSGYKPTDFESGHENAAMNKSRGTAGATTAPDVPVGNGSLEGFATLESSPMPFADAEKPANCYPKNQLSPSELLPSDPNSKWAQMNPMGQGDISGKNFLSAGAMIGVNTVGQSLRNANQQLRSEPSNPQMNVSIWNQSTIEPDLDRRPLEGF